MLNGGSISDALKAGAIGAVVGGATAGLLHGIGAAELPWFERGLAHGVVQGGATEAIGGEFRHGFYAGFAVGSNEGVIGQWAKGSNVRGIAAAATVGGTASALGGGKFANGAVSGTFSYLFNYLSREKAKFDVVFYDADQLEANEIELVKKMAVNYGGVAVPISDSQEIVSYLEREDRVFDSVVLFSHAGGGGRFGLGKAEFDLDSAVWKKLRNYVASKLYVLGCNVASGSEGQNYINAISKIVAVKTFGTPYYTGIDDKGYLHQALTAVDLRKGNVMKGFPLYESK